MGAGDRHCRPRQCEITRRGVSSSRRAPVDEKVIALGQTPWAGCVAASGKRVGVGQVVGGGWSVRKREETNVYYQSKMSMFGHILFVSSFMQGNNFQKYERIGLLQVYFIISKAGFIIIADENQYQKIVSIIL